MARHVKAIPLCSLLVMIALVASAWHLVRTDQDHRLSAELTAAAVNVSTRLEAHVSTRLALGLHMRDHWIGEMGLPERTFLRVAYSVHAQFPDIQAINWIDPDGIIRWVAPIEGNEAARNLDVMKLDLPAAALRQARESGKAELSPPIPLAQGGLGIVTYIRLGTKDAPQGYINLVLRVLPLMQAALPRDQLTQFAIRITDGDSVLYNTTGSRQTDHHGVNRSIQIQNRTWELTLAPLRATMRRHESWIDEMVLAIGVAFSLATAWLIRLVMLRQLSVRENEARFRDIATVSSDWFWEMDENLCFTYISDRFEEVTGTKAEDRLGTRRWDPISNEELASRKWLEHMADLQAHRPFRDFEYSLDFDLGTTLYWRISGVPRFDAEGKFIGYRGSASNVTGQKFAARALDAAEEKLREILDKTPVAIVICDHPEDDAEPLPGRRVFVNAAMVEMFQATTKEELLGESITDTWVDQGEMQRLESIFRSGDTISGFECRRRRRDGTTIWTSINSLPIHFDGKDCTMLWIFDIDATKRMQLALQESEAQLRAVFDYTPVCINLKDLEGRYLWLNKPYEEWLGFPSDQIIGRRVRELLGDTEEVERVEAAEREVLRIGENYESEVRVVKDGKVFDRILIKFPVKADDGTVYGLGTVALDITERKQMETALETAKIQAERANAAKSEFLAHMSHDLRTPLNAIVGFSEIMSQQTFGPLGEAHYEEYVDLIHQSGRRLVSMVNDILDLSRIESGEYTLDLEEVDLRQVFEAARKRCAPTDINRPDIQLDIGVDLAPPHIHADERAVSQIVDNLLTNAIKYGGPDASIRLSWTTGPDGFGRLQVADTGPGIDPKELRKITQPFVRGGRAGNAGPRVAKPVEGVGLGLSIVSRLAELHGATVSIESEIGKGTAVTVTFPKSCLC